MSNYVNFAELKARITFEQTAQKLGLVLKKHGTQLRGLCPRCKDGGDRALVLTEGKGFYCFSANTGGDQIALAGHILDCEMKEAAQFLAAGTVPTVQNSKQSTVTVPQGARGDETKKFEPLDYLQSEHDAVIAVGFCPKFAAKHGIGYAGKGIMRGTVAIPFRDESGNLLGYIGVQDAALPADFTPNVVSLDKKRA